MNKLRYGLYILAIILLNIAATTLFFRVDLTENRSYSLSPVSRDLVKNLEEPLTIKVFLSESLPVPYNTLERDLRDILMEYKLKANRHFNFTIDLIDREEEPTVNPEIYNIYPVNIQNIEQDEVKIVSAYIGMTFIHGDLVETIQAIQYNQNLELIITDKIRTLTEKSTSLLSLKENIKLKLYLSPILYNLSNEIKNYGNIVENLVSDINADFFNKIDFEFIEVKNSDINALQDKYSVTTLNLEDESGRVTQAVSSIIIDKDNDFSKIDLINKDIFGRTVITSGDELKDEISSSINKMIGAKTKIGYLTSNGTIPMNQNQMMNLSGQQEPSINNLNSIIGQNYNMAAVDLSSGKINSDIKTLIIVRPNIKFSQRELFILDQFLLKGNSILLAVDQLTMDMEKSNPNYGIEVYKALDHGLTELLEHYGIKINPNMVMDEKSFKQVQRDAKGSIIETQVYFAPLIQKENLNSDLIFLNGVNELITFRMSEVNPIDPEDKSITSLFTTTENGWIVEAENLSMNPGRIQPGIERKKLSTAAIKEGNFVSYFNNREIPKQELRTPEAEDDIDQLSGVVEKEDFISESASGKIMVLGSSDMLTDSILSQNYKSNIIFIQNVIDYLSGREDYLQMRSKGVFHRPMEETTSVKRNFIKYFNIVGLPLLVALSGIFAYLLWLNKKKKIYQMFMEDQSEK